jgi:hypothetical protein
MTDTKTPKPQAKPMPIAQKIEGYGRKTLTAAQRRRVATSVHRELKRIGELRGAVKGAAMRKLAKAPLEGIVSPATLAVIHDPKWAPKPKAQKEAPVG